jgi:acyl-CoA thioester hydrolase
VRFAEVDHYGYMWHGHVMSHFECARVALAREFKLLTADLLESELILPMLDATCVYKSPALEDEELIIQATVLKPDLPAPLLVFIYRAIHAGNGREAFRGRSRQVFTRRDGRMVTRLPEVMSARLSEMWRHLDKQPVWPDAREIVASFASVGSERVVCAP